MAQVAYDLERFAPSQRPTARPRVRVAVAKRGQIQREKTERQKQTARMLRVLVAGVLLVILVSGVIYTQVTLSELQKQIASQKKVLQDEESLSAYLNFEMENMTNMKIIEEKAGEMGMEKAGSGQIIYFRAEDDDTIKVKEGPLATLWEKFKTDVLGIIDYVGPQ